MSVERAPEPTVNAALALQHGLSQKEFQSIYHILGRPPRFTELGIFSVMWSEHCSYKSSRVHLRGLPTSGPRVIQGPGENAGVVDIGDNQAIVFKMESHNHPSFIEPVQGAATGVGGICRDVFTMGARPIALADALRFGAPEQQKTRFLISGVVHGIGMYGNAFGVPTVAGDVSFDDSYDGNILVNVLCLGIAPADRIFKGRAAGPGNPVLYVGAKTGRDGIHGATMASAEFGKKGAEHKRPNVQVGDPFMEKLLLEACLELMQKDCLVGIQDMGAAGLTSSSVEMAARAETGIELWLEKVPTRETGMTPYEVLLSESQERMLMVVEKGREDEALAIFDKWDLDAAVIGVVTDTGELVAKLEDDVYAEIPLRPLADGLTYDRPMNAPKYLQETSSFDPLALPAPPDLGKALVKLMGAPNVASKEWVYRQYDHNVRHGTVVRPGAADAGVVRVLGPGGVEKGIAITTDCNSRLCYLDPYEGARQAVAEAAANLVAVGAEPLAVTDCLNFGNPEKIDIMWQFAQAVKGMGDACRELAVPIVSGNVSFYNETEGKAIHPTPMIGMVGLLPDARQHVTQFFRREGEAVALIGRNTGSLAGSLWLKALHGKVAGKPPRLDVARAKKCQAALLAMARAGLLSSAHDVSEGGLAVCLAECTISGPQPVGFLGSLAPDELLPHQILFGEEPTRWVISYPLEQADAVQALAEKHGAPFLRIGMTGGDYFTLRVGKGDAGEVDLPVAQLAEAWKTGFRKVAE